MKEVIYLGHYDTADNSEENRAYWLASTNKMDYIANSIKKNGYKVTIVSASKTRNKKRCKGHIYQLADNEQLILFPSFGFNGFFSRCLRKIQTDWHLIVYFLKNIQKGQPVIVYHSLTYLKLIIFLKKIINFKLILEVNELYSDVTLDKKTRINEMKIIDVADAYIFSTEILDEKINHAHKRFIINHGTYSVEKPVKDLLFEKNKKHLLYAGTFSKIRGAARAAALSGRFLTSDYHIHLIGTGTADEIEELKRIGRNNLKNGAAAVTIDGLLSGEEYIRFLQSCDLGFNTQLCNATYNDTSFPSKVLSYLSNGLRVVSVRIPVIEKSIVNPLVTYYEGNDPEAIANAVKSIDWSKPYDAKKVVEKMDIDFVNAIGELLNV
ncbi:MAG: glycosyltransferase family 4 protein [Ruminococcaceae bacterium]|nr:glycosyltransferase family 4 protein [Oscillospiraceae bacterium]